MTSRDDAERDFTAFAAARTQALARTAYLLTGDPHLAEDLVQTTLFLAAKAWHRLDGDPEPYVRRILHNQHVSGWRRRRARPAETTLGTHDRAAPTPPDADVRLTLDAALRRLTPRQRSVVVLRFYDDLTEVETGRVLGLSPGTVKSTCRDALAKLRALAPELADVLGDSR